MKSDPARVAAVKTTVKDAKACTKVHGKAKGQAEEQAGTPQVPDQGRLALPSFP